MFTGRNYRKAPSITPSEISGFEKEIEGIINANKGKAKDFYEIDLADINYFRWEFLKDNYLKILKEKGFLIVDNKENIIHFKYK